MTREKSTVYYEKKQKGDYLKMKTKLIVAGVLFVLGSTIEGLAGVVLGSEQLAEVIATVAKVAVKKA